MTREIVDKISTCGLPKGGASPKREEYLDRMHSKIKIHYDTDCQHVILEQAKKGKLNYLAVLWSPLERMASSWVDQVRSGNGFSVGTGPTGAESEL